MMQMLNAGGIPALTDGSRVADQHNPQGYFEDDRTRRLSRDASWLHEASGKAVKIIYRLLPHLPPTFDYRFLFMERDLNEAYDSQQDMLQSRNDPTAAQDRDRMILALSRDLDIIKQWLGEKRDIRQLVVPYSDLVMKPRVWASEVSRFLDGGLDELAMATAVNPALYRHRSRQM